MTEEIIKSIYNTTTQLKNNSTLPKKQGIYTYFIENSNDLGVFGGHNRVIYVGLSEKNLNGRDTNTHLKSDITGWSTLRRSLGAILKNKLDLEAENRDICPKKLRADKYKFASNGEIRLTEWMLQNLKLGFWATDEPFTKRELRTLEKNVILSLKPTLDLDKRTKMFNPFSFELDKLREICRMEVKNKSLK
jgi:hypothetical protein